MASLRAEARCLTSSNLALKTKNPAGGWGSVRETVKDRFPISYSDFNIAHFTGFCSLLKSQAI
jgi:hypothetical protein